MIELHYDFGNGDFEFYVSATQLRKALIDAIIRDAPCTEQEAIAFYDVANKFDIDLVELFDEDLHEYFEDDAREEDERKTKEDKAEREQWNRDYLRSISF